MATAGESSKSPIPPSMTSMSSGPSMHSTLFQPSPALDRFCQWISSLLGTDQLIMLIQYSLDIITHHMDKSTLSRLLLILKNRLPFLSPTTQTLASTESGISPRLKKLSAKLSDVRILLRLHGIIPTYQWMLSTHASPPTDPVLAIVAKLQNYVNMLYFPLENAAYLGSQEIIPMTKRTETDLWLWSCRFWGAHVALEFVRLWKERQIHLKGKATEKGDEGKWERKWWAQLVMNLAYAPLTVHWSLENGLPLRNVDIGYFGVIAAIASIYLGYPA